MLCYFSLILISPVGPQGSTRIWRRAWCSRTARRARAPRTYPRGEFIVYSCINHHRPVKSSTTRQTIKNRGMKKKKKKKHNSYNIHIVLINEPHVLSYLGWVVFTYGWRICWQNRSPACHDAWSSGKWRTCHLNTTINHISHTLMRNITRNVSYITVLKK